LFLLKSYLLTTKFALFVLNDISTEVLELVSVFQRLLLRIETAHINWRHVEFSISLSAKILKELFGNNKGSQ
jgi:hypothetical protein